MENEQSDDDLMKSTTARLRDKHPARIMGITEEQFSDKQLDVLDNLTMNVSVRQASGEISKADMAKAINTLLDTYDCDPKATVKLALILGITAGTASTILSNPMSAMGTAMEINKMIKSGKNTTNLNMDELESLAKDLDEIAKVTMSRVT